MSRRVILSLLVFLLFAGLASDRDVKAETYILQVDLYGSEEVPAGEASAYGFVRFFFSDDRMAANYTVDVKGLGQNSILGADIHRGGRGANGPVVRHLADGGFIVTAGNTTFSQQDLDEMAAGQWYISLKTAAHPQGGMRGQIGLPADFFPRAPSEPATVGQPVSRPPAGDSGSFFRPPSTGDGALVR